MASSFDYDVVVLGAGPGGYVGAIRASQLGLKAAVIEKDKLGGVCLNIGCIPSKALIHQAEVMRSVPELKELGVKVDLSGLDYQKAFRKSRKAADTLSKGVGFLLKKNTVEVINGQGKLTGPNEITVDGSKKITGKSIILATGSRPRAIPGFEFDEKTVLSSTGALMLEKLPKKMLILGGGAIGVEFAHIMNGFGVEVHLVELLDQLLPLEDPEIVKVLDRSFKKRGIKVHTGTKASGLTKKKSGLTVSLETTDGSKQELEVDQALVVVGRAANTEDIGLDALGIPTERGFVQVGHYYQTTVPSVYAIGDIVASPQLAHVASKEAEIAVEHIAGKNPPARLDPLSIPGAVYCEPQVASFGLTEKKANDKGISFHKATFPYRGAGKSVAIGKSEGTAKVLYTTESSEIIGAHVVGAEATELIHELLLARTAELLPEDIATMTHAHPTLSETVMELMRAAEGWAIHA